MKTRLTAGIVKAEWVKAYMDGFLKVESAKEDLVTTYRSLN